MRTTLTVDDDTLRQAKLRAAQLGVTLGQLVTRALQEVLLQRSSSDEPPFRMITYGEGGRGRHREPSELKAALDAEEAATWDRS